MRDHRDHSDIPYTGGNTGDMVNKTMPFTVRRSDLQEPNNSLAQRASQQLLEQTKSMLPGVQKHISKQAQVSAERTRELTTAFKNVYTGRSLD